MKFTNPFKTFSPIEMALFIIFVIYLVFPIQTPMFLAPSIESPLGMGVIFVVTLSLFLYANPILAILYIFVAYELLRRSSQIPGKIHIAEHTPTEVKKTAEMKAMNPPVKETLEEQIVDKMAPVGKSDPSIYTASSFKPVAESVGTASVF